MSDQTPPPPPPPSGAGSDQPPAPGYWKASDGNWYPPQQQTPQQAQQFSPVPPPQASSGMPGWAVGCLVAFGVVAVLGILAVGCVAVVADQAAEEIDQAILEQEFDNAGEAADVTLVSCGVDELGNLNADVRVTNNSSERSNYFIDVAFDASSGDQLETSLVTVSALDPGQSTTQPAFTFTARPEATEVSCRVADVERLSDE